MALEAIQRHTRDSTRSPARARHSGMIGSVPHTWPSIPCPTWNLPKQETIVAAHRIQPHAHSKHCPNSSKLWLASRRATAGNLWSKILMDRQKSKNASSRCCASCSDIDLLGIPYRHHQLLLRCHNGNASSSPRPCWDQSRVASKKFPMVVSFEYAHHRREWWMELYVVDDPC